MPDSLIVEAIRRVQAMHDELKQYQDENDRPGGWVDEDGSWIDYEAEAADRETCAGLDAYLRVLDVLQILAHGGTPAQGE